MSDCSTNAFAVPMRKVGDKYEPEKPTLKKLGQLNGEPPWTLSLPFPEALPIEALDFIGVVEVGGKRFYERRPRREEDFEWMNG